MCQRERRPRANIDRYESCCSLVLYRFWVVVRPDHLKRIERSIAELLGTLRLLDPELPREYVESLGKLQASLVRLHEARRDDTLLANREAMLKKVHQLGEVTLMLGHRGVRLGITYPEIYEMRSEPTISPRRASRSPAGMPKISSCRSTSPTRFFARISSRRWTRTAWAGS